MRGWLAVPIVLVLALLVALPVAALTETGIEEYVKEAVGLEDESCDPAPNLASPWLEGPPLAEQRDEPRALAGGTSAVEEIAPDRSLLDPSRKLTRLDPLDGRYEELAPLPRGLNHVGL